MVHVVIKMKILHAYKMENVPNIFQRGLLTTQLLTQMDIQYTEGEIMVCLLERENLWLIIDL
jgi:hypothetical protein